MHNYFGGNNMKKTIIILCCILMVFVMFGCAKKAEPVEETPEPTAEPTATPEIITIETPFPTATPEPKKVGNDMKGILISDADVDSVMNDDVAEWEGFSVVTNDEVSETVFYVISEENSEDLNKAVGSVIMTYDENTVSKVVCNVFTDQYKNNPEACKKLFDYFKNDFALSIIGNLTEETWKSILDEINMDFEEALQSVSEENLNETEEQEAAEGVSKGQFTYTVDTNVVSFAYDIV